MVVVHAAEIRVLGTTAIEDYHAHLLRLDRASCFPGDERGVDAHCLDLLASGAILIGAYVKRGDRAGPHRAARRSRDHRRGRLSRPRLRARIDREGSRRGAALPHQRRARERADHEPQLQDPDAGIALPFGVISIGCHSRARQRGVHLWVNASLSESRRQRATPPADRPPRPRKARRPARRATRTAQSVTP